MSRFRTLNSITTCAATVWNFDAEYAKLPRDPYVQNIGVGRFRAYSKYRYYFPGTQGDAAAPGKLVTEVGRCRLTVSNPVLKADM